jgi:hypothetical protein
MKHDNMKYGIGATVALIIAFIAIIGVGIYVSDSKTSFGTIEIPLSANATTTSFTISSTTAQLVLSANSGSYRRTYANLGTSTVYMWEYSTSTGLSAGIGIPVFGSTIREEYGDNLWKGNAYMITSSGETSTVAVTDYY